MTISMETAFMTKSRPRKNQLEQSDLPPVYLSYNKNIHFTSLLSAVLFSIPTSCFQEWKTWTSTNLLLVSWWTPMQKFEILRGKEFEQVLHFVKLRLFFHFLFYHILFSILTFPHHKCQIRKVYSRFHNSHYLKVFLAVRVDPLSSWSLH